MALVLFITISEKIFLPVYLMLLITFNALGTILNVGIYSRSGDTAVNEVSAATELRF